MQKIDDIRQNYKFRKDEIFRRMKVTTFVQLAIQIHRVTLMESENHISDITSDAGDLTMTDRTEDTDVDKEVQLVTGGSTSPVPSLAVTEGDFGIDSKMDSERSTLQSVIRGMGQYDISHPRAPPPQAADNICPYLLLDVRDSDDYMQCHLVTAVSYPKANLSRATNYESKEMLAYKNKPGKIIIIYDEDERLAHSVATTLVQRGYDNLFMLSGGLKVSYKLFPETLLTGTPPASICSGKSSRQPQADTQAGFSSEDIDKLQMHLDNALLDSTFGSRLSNSSRSFPTSIMLSIPSKMAGDWSYIMTIDSHDRRPSDRNRSSEVQQNRIIKHNRERGLFPVVQGEAGNDTSHRYVYPLLLRN
ncbi:Centrosomal protein of 41 kDa [Lamellibrachia satsuma]|nr:Centrosomal protein of 41 kDa [Lamellibrachia satsuma]